MEIARKVTMHRNSVLTLCLVSSRVKWSPWSLSKVTVRLNDIKARVLSGTEWVFVITCFYYKNLFFRDHFQQFTAKIQELLSIFKIRWWGSACRNWEVILSSLMRLPFPGSWGTVWRRWAAWLMLGSRAWTPRVRPHGGRYSEYNHKQCGVTTWANIFFYVSFNVLSGTRTSHWLVVPSKQKRPQHWRMLKDAQVWTPAVPSWFLL